MRANVFDQLTKEGKQARTVTSKSSTTISNRLLAVAHWIALSIPEMKYSK